VAAFIHNESSCTLMAFRVLQCAKVYWMGFAWDRSLEDMQERIQAMRLGDSNPGQ
jgi:uncharacterized protein with PIN domain